MNKQELTAMIELLKKEENADLRKEFVKIFVSTIESDPQLKSRVTEIADKSLSEKIRRIR